MFQKHSTFFVACLFLLQANTIVLAKTDLCKTLKPCGDRGHCVLSSDAKSKDVLATKCFCVLDYSGTWCQFVDGHYKAAKNKKDVPVAPSIVTNTNTPDYNLQYKLKFKDVKSPRSGKILYYIVRYDDEVEPKKYEWRTITVVVKPKQKVYTVTLDTLVWGRDYVIQIYAANRHGLGPPTKQTLRRPKVSIPRVVETSDDLSTCWKMPIKLYCKAQGDPAPKYSWRLNGKPLAMDASVNTKDGHLTITKPTARQHAGEYRCLATNTWGTVLSRPIHVEFSVPRSFIQDKNDWDGAVVDYDVKIGAPFELSCPDHVPTNSESIKWSVVEKDKVIDFPLSERVWVTSNGNLYFAYVVQNDIDFINTGIRCNLGNTLEAGRPFEGSNRMKLVKKGVEEPKIPLAFHEKPKNVKVIHGSRAEFHCLAKSSSKTIIQWMKGNSRVYLKNDEKYKILDYGRVLRIENAGDSDAGQVSCVAYVESEEKNKDYEKKKLPKKYSAKDVQIATATLSVFGPSQFKYSLVSGISIYRGTSLTLACGNDENKNEVKWYINGLSLGPRKKDVINGEKISYSSFGGLLEIPSVEQFASGVYQCDVGTKLGVVTMAEYVYIRGFDPSDPLDVKHKRSDNILLEEGSSVTLTCLPKPFHDFSVVWENLPESNTPHFREMENGFLEIHGVKKSDSMTLSCHIPFHIPFKKSVSIKRSIRTKVVQSVNGSWNEWGLWSSCSVPTSGCNESNFIRKRACKNPEPKYDGRYCSGTDREISHGVEKSFEHARSLAEAWACDHPIGLENGEFKDSAMSSSHKSRGQVVPTSEGMMEAAHPDYARLNGKHAWCAQLGIPENQQSYLQLFFGGVMNISGIATQGMSGNPWYSVASFSLRFSMDEIGWFDYSKPNKIWEGNSKNHLTRKHVFGHSMFSFLMRIYLETYTFVPCMRIEVYGCRTDIGGRLSGTNLEHYNDRLKDRKERAIAYEGIISSWSPWSGCLLPAGSKCGDQSRVRVSACKENFKIPMPFGKFKLACDKLKTEKEVCGRVHCPDDIGWSWWSNWSNCSTSCGPGTRTRSRTCLNPNPKKKVICKGKTKITDSCNIKHCIVDGNWSPWSTWSACSVKCGTGMKSRNRSCSNPAPKHGGMQCKGERAVTAKCVMKPCKVNGGWTVWSLWSSCSNTCGENGVKSRSRTCSNPTPNYGGITCNGDDKDTSKCVTKSCLVHGGWSSWSEWGVCSVTCGSGMKYRSRTCSNPTPKYGGMKCKGENDEKLQCTMDPCKVDGGWTSWSTWSICSASCGSGLTFRAKNCSDPAPLYGGMDCEGESNETSECLIKMCAVHGGWSLWSGWTSCSAKCNSGEKKRSRICSNPVPKYGGMPCEGDVNVTIKCNTKPCKVHGSWSSWSKWSVCSRTCDSGVKTRVRQCSKPKHGGRKCHGDKVIKTKCNTMSCPEEVGVLKKLFSKKITFDNKPLVIAAAGVLLLVFIFTCCCCRRICRKKKIPKDECNTGEIESLLKKEGPIDGESSFAWDSPADASHSASKSQTVPPPPPPPNVSTSRGKHRGVKKTKMGVSDSIYGQTFGFGTANLENGSGKIKDALIKTKMKKSPDVPLPPLPPSATPEFGKATLESGSGTIKDAQIQKASRMKKSASDGPHAFGMATLEGGSGLIKDAQIQKTPKMKKSASDAPHAFGMATLEGGSGLIKDAQIHKSLEGPPSIPQSRSAAPPPPPPPPSPHGGAIALGKPSGQPLISSEESTYGGLVGFENAILEPGKEDMYVKKAKIQKISSKKNPKAT